MATRSGHPLPQISYDEVMAIQLDDPESGARVPVRNCHASLFRKAVFAACETHPACNDIKEQLRGLQFRFMPDRWWSVNLLVKYGIAFPLKPPEAVDSQADEEEAVLKALWVQPAQPE